MMCCQSNTAGVLRRRRKNTETQGRGPVQGKADIGVILPQDKESQEPLGAGRGKKDFPLESADRVRMHFCCFKLPNL